MGALVGFVAERSKSLVSKKLGAAFLTAFAASTGSPPEVTYAGIAYLFVQGAVDCFKYWVDSRPA